MTAQTIIKEMEDIIRGSYAAWTVGVTDDPARRRREHNNPRWWYTWNTRNEDEARDIEGYFCGKGCQGGDGGPGKVDYIYLFL